MITRFPKSPDNTEYIDNVSGILNTKIDTLSGYVDTISGGYNPALSGYLDNKIDNNTTYIDNTSGILNSKFDNYATVVSVNTTSGILNTYITNVSGQLDTRINNSGAYSANVSGILNTYITNTSGILNTRITTTSGDLSGHMALTTTAHGGFYSTTQVDGISGILNTYITNTSGILNAKFNDYATISSVNTTSGILNTYITNTSGILNTKIDNVSGSLQTLITNNTTYITNTSGILNTKFNSYLPISSGLVNSNLGNLGTAGTIAKFGATGLANSIVTESGTAITVSGTTQTTAIGINVTPTATPLGIVGYGATSATYGILVKNSSSANCFYTRNDGSVYMQGNVGINVAPAAGIRVYISDSKTNTATVLGQQIIFTNNSTIAGSYDAYAQYFEMNCTGNAANGAESYAVQGVGYNYMTANNAGVTSFQASYGNQLNTAGTLASAIGLKLGPRCRSGTITNLYDIYIASPLTGGTITNDWCIYSLHAAPSRLIHNLQFASDTYGTVYGVAQYCSVIGNGTHMVFNSRLVGTGNFVFSGGKVGIGVTPTYQLDILNNQNSGTWGWIKNANNHADAGAGWIAEGASGCLMGIEAGFPGNVTPRYNDRGVLISSANIGMTIEQAGNFPIDFYTNSTKRMIIDGNGLIGFGRTPIQYFDIQKDQNTYTFCRITNADNTVGGSSYAGFMVESYNSKMIEILSISPNYSTTKYSGKGVIYNDNPSGLIFEQAGALPIDFYTNGTKRFTIDATGTLNASGSLAAYANNAAAIAGGKVVGDFYRTGGDPDLICYVH